MTNSDSFISVVIPTCDRKDTLSECVKALENQSLSKDSYEIIVVDDGSKDGTKELLQQLSKELQNLRIFTQPRGGPAKARNTGVKNAKGSVILFTGDDCIADKNLLKEHLRLHKEGEPVAVLGHIKWHPDLDVTPFMKYLVVDTQFSFPTIEKRPHNVSFCYFYTSNISAPKRCIEGVRGFDEDFRDATFEDVELGYRLWKSGVRIIYNPRAVTYHHHAVCLEDYAGRQVKAGRAAALLYRKHPEMGEFLRIPQAASPEPRIRYYKAVLDYHFFIGLQEGLESGKEDAHLLPFEDRLRNWSSANGDELMARLQNLEEHREELAEIIGTQAEEIKRLHGEVARRDDLVRTLDGKNREKYAKIVELEKFVDRVKGNLAYKIYRLLTGRG